MRLRRSAGHCSTLKKLALLRQPPRLRKPAPRMLLSVSPLLGLQEEAAAQAGRRLPQAKPGRLPLALRRRRPAAA